MSTGNSVSKVRGVVKWFNDKKGWGFIADDETGEDVFVHYRSIQQDGFKTLREGQVVDYLRVRSDKGWQSAELEIVEEQTAV